MPAVIFVCTANICRSPMASELYKSLLSEKGLESFWRVESAGTWAAEGQPAAAGSIMALGSKGLELSTHRSRRITGELLEPFDLILTMETNHKEALRFEFPNLAERVYLLSEMVDRDFDIADPIGGTNTDYEKTANEIAQILQEGFDRIVALSTRHGFVNE